MKVRTDIKREEILETARKVFLEFGYERASMAEISIRMRGSKATLYGYFSSKEVLFRAIVTQLAERHVSPVNERLEQSINDVPRVALQRFGEHFLTFVSDSEAVTAYQVAVSEAAHSDIGEAFYETGVKQTVKSLARYLEGAMVRGDLRRADPSIAAQHLLALLAHAELLAQYFLRKAPSVESTQIKGIVERALDLFLNGYKP